MTISITESLAMVQTHRGIIPIDYVKVGDRVYSYGSGAELEVLGLNHHEENIYKVEYNDGRISYHSGSELPYLDKLPLSQHYIDYNQKTVVNPLYPDPYVAGALLIYGDLGDPYVNLPSDSTVINNIFSHKYQLTYSDSISPSGKVYFRYIGDDADKKITWKEFFSNYLFEGNPYTLQDAPIVPLEYHRASISDRLKFIRGAFDIGYDKKTFPDDCGISHTSKEKLEEIQKVLWSLGILSTISFDAETPCGVVADSFSVDNPIVGDTGKVKVNIAFKLPENYNGKDYRLYVLGKHSVYPGYFYNIESIENMIENNYKKNRKYLKFKLQINSVNFHTKIEATSLILHKPNMAYILDNFLPKISGEK